MDDLEMQPVDLIDGSPEAWKRVVEQQARELRRLVEENHELATYKIQHRGTIELVVAELRHAYRPLCREEVKKQKMLADGLIAPAIRRLEKLLGNDL